MRYVIAVLLLLVPVQLLGVDSLTVNGATSGQLTTPGAWVLRATCSPGQRVTFAFVLDADGNGLADSGEPVLDQVPVRDRTIPGDPGVTDEEAVGGTVQFTYTVVDTYLDLPLVVRAFDSTGSYVEHGYTSAYAAQAQTLTGRVVDESGAGRGGIVMRAWALPEHEYRTMTAADGSYTLTVPVGSVEVYVDETPLNSLWAAPIDYFLVMTAGATKSGLNFRLVADGPYELSGQVTAGGQPVPGATVSAYGNTYTSYGSTDINGEYTLSVAGDSYWVFADGPNGWSGSNSMGTEVTVPPAGTADISDLEVCTALISGQVLAGSDPVAGAVVEGETYEGYDYYATPTNAAGRYALWVRNAPAEEWEVWAWCSGYAESIADYYTVYPGGSINIPLYQNVYTITGRVTVGMNPLACWVLAAEWNGDIDGYWWTDTDADGYYTLTVPAGTYDVYGYNYRNDTYTTDAMVTRPGSGAVNLTADSLGTAATLSNGRVLPTAGNTTTPYTYSVTFTDAAGRLPYEVSVLIDGVPYNMEQTDPADEDSTNGIGYTLTYDGGLSAGSHTFRFAVTGWLAPSIITTDQSGPAVEAPPLTVTLTPEDGTVSGTVHAVAVPDSVFAITKVEFYLEGGLVATDTTAPYTYDWDTWPVSVADGLYALEVIAYDAGDRQASDVSLLTVDNTTFEDVPKGNPQWAYVEAMAREGITAGCQQAPPLYCPNSAVTRGQMAVFLCRAAGWSPVYPETPTFADVPKTSGQYGYIEAMKVHGVTSGCGGVPLKYCPNDAVTRGQMAVFLCRAAGVPTQNPATPTFTDVPKTSGQYAYVEGMYAAGITAGCVTTPPRQYCPNSPVTRGQMAVFLCRAFGISTTP